jgi:thioredoxin-related protein
MKIYVVLLSLACSLLAIDAKDAAFVLGFNEDYKTALTQAKEENKLMMLVIIQDPCPYCERLIDNTLSDPQITKALEDFVPVIVNKHSKLPPAFRTNAIPMTFFIDPKNEEGIWESMGYISVEQFLDDLNEAKLIHSKE